MRRIFMIKNNIILVDNSIKEYDELINNRFLSFSFIDEEESLNIKNYLIINEYLTKIRCLDYIYNIKGILKKTDLYLIINNIISNLVNDYNNIYLHSAIISYNNIGVLLLGDFGSGKTTLSLEAEKRGFEINSSDQSWIKKEKNELVLEKGSRFLVYNQSIRILDNNYVNKKVKIKKILVLKGICDKGLLKIDKIDDNIRKYKIVSKYATWHIKDLLITDDISLSIDLKNVKTFLNNLDVDIYSVRGDSLQLIEKLKEKIQ